MQALSMPSFWSSLRLVLFFTLLASQSIITAYDSSSMQFHPDGRVLQIEYCKDAVKKGCPIGAYRCKDGVVIIAVRKAPTSKFLVNPLQKVFQVDSNIMIAATGLLFDASVIVDVAKRICSQYRTVYCDDIPVESLCEDLSEIMHKQTTGNSRPFGVSLIISGIDKVLGPQLYVLDPEGSVNAWNAVCIGKQAEKVMDHLSNTFSDIFSDTTKELNIADVWPTFQSSLRKFFPSKLGASSAIIAQKKSQDDLDRSIALERIRENSENGENSANKEISENGGKPYKHGFDSSLPPTLITEKNNEDDIEEYWELEVTSIMLNSVGEVCMLPMRLIPLSVGGN